MRDCSERDWSERNGVCVVFWWGAWEGGGESRV